MVSSSTVNPPRHQDTSANNAHWSILPRKWLSARSLAVGIAGVAMAIEISTRLPSSASIKPMNLPPSTEHLILLIHGTGCKDEPLMHDIEARYQSLFADESNKIVKHLTWSPWSDNIFRAEVNAVKLGKTIGDELAAYPDLKQLHIISHSAGAFMQTPICETLRAQTDQTPHIQMTLLDSMLLHGGWFDPDYGTRHYGACADSATAIFTRNTPINGCNKPLQHAYNIDVSELVPTHPEVIAEAKLGWPASHYYPIKWYLDHMLPSHANADTRSHQDHPRGAIEKPSSS